MCPLIELAGLFGGRPRNASSAFFVTTMRRAVTRTEGNRPDAINSYVALRPMPRIFCTSYTLSTSRASSRLPLRFVMSTPEMKRPAAASCRASFPRIIMRAKVKRYLLRQLYRKAAAMYTEPGEIDCSARVEGSPCSALTGRP